MSSFKEMTGKAVAMDRTNVDTDQIIPKQFLKRIEKTGFGQYLFYDWRFKPNGELNENFELNLPENHGASILIANENFGCGSSREHAPWALMDYGFKVIIAPSFADIFHQNCLKNGVLPIVLKEDEVAYLLKQSRKQPYELTVSLENKSVLGSDGFKAEFDIHPYWYNMLLNGWDEIELTLQLEERIREYEAEHSGNSTRIS
ncbi:3-isopropylmalate dehydratase small subunit [Mesobacillus subterraneus]|jgi:3-isopropylmalate/(R)-2-methylmalate dehydratase small subunit|uniref:3-isopropylmalate dehydratase small subunit n=1 Tax=Mesobacillus subterraneus TaxID=285983 RepID=UPI00203CD24F|nr:3-isopropylmalate dehydratase small subunit [Mesobacillus subterraneus]MCM3663803.1 3-isopropylmalate dehydratase small subunit [Mesobacillus subterraneus]MCM3683564.1 3-isopropylmalate dehydratase small subunit [Mesobacillus subterraneus]